MRVAEWATPHVQKWHRERNLNRNEAQRHLEARNWSEAEKHFHVALAERQHSTVDRLELLLGLAEAERRQGKLAEAERNVCDSVKIAVREENETMHSLALEALANVQLDQQRYEDAEKSAREVIRLETTRAKPDHARLASCSRKLASALEKSDRPAEAIGALKSAVSHAEKAFGGEHADTAVHLQELGILHRRHGHHAAAQACFRRAIMIHRKVQADSQEATETLYHLAGSLEESGDLHGAEAEFEKMLALRERQIGANPTETAVAQVRLAALHLRTGRLSSARELLTRALPTLERKGGPMLAQALETLASAEERMGRGDQARQYREKAMVEAALHAAEAGK
ncbi:MAG TPA: tetratricopeptide repeat protein [Bryobacteraceae bacterium]